MKNQSNIAVYPGTFDPATYGHLDIIRRGLSLFEHVVVAVSDHERKNVMFPLETRMNMMHAATADLGGRVSILPFSNLLVEFAAGQKAKAILRGLRASPDFDYEFQMAQFAKDQHPDIEIIYLMATRDILHISATAVRELLRLGADASAYLPPEVTRLIKNGGKTA